MTHLPVTNPHPARPQCRVGWLFYRSRGSDWTSYVFKGRFVDIRLDAGGWLADEVCEDGAVGFELAKADSELKAFEAVELLWATSIPAAGDLPVSAV